jgi:hypothetical protein
MPSKRGDRAAPPPRPDDWDVLLHSTEAAKGWDELCRTAPGNMWEAWVILRERPIQPVNRERQHQLRGSLQTREVKGKGSGAVAVRGNRSWTDLVLPRS